MFSYIEPNFIEKILWESGFSNLSQVTIFTKQKFVFGRYFEKELFSYFFIFFILFADLWLS